MIRPSTSVASPRFLPGVFKGQIQSRIEAMVTAAWEDSRVLS